MSVAPATALETVPSLPSTDGLGLPSACWTRLQHSTSGPLGASQLFSSVTSPFWSLHVSRFYSCWLFSSAIGCVMVHGQEGNLIDSVGPGRWFITNRSLRTRIARRGALANNRGIYHSSVSPLGCLKGHKYRVCLQLAAMRMRHLYSWHLQVQIEPVFKQEFMCSHCVPAGNPGAPPAAPRLCIVGHPLGQIAGSRDPCQSWPPAGRMECADQPGRWRPSEVALAG